MPAELLDLLPWLLVPVGAFYLGVPLLIRFQQKLPARPELRELDLRAVDPAVGEFLRTRTEALLDLGFGEPVLLKIDEPAPNVTAYLIVVVHRAAGDKAMATALIGTGPTPIQTWYVEFSTRFESGEVFDTLNTGELNAFPPGPTTVRTQVPSVEDPAELYALHRFVMGRHPPDGRPWVYPPGGAVEYLLEYAFGKSYDQQAQRGLLYHDRANDCYRPTVYGAYRMTWGLLAPFKHLRLMGMRRRERDVLAAFDRARAAG